MKKLCFIPLAIILILGLILSSCGGKTPAPEPAPAPGPTTPAPTPAPETAKPIKLRWAHGVPPVTAFQTKAFTPWAEMVKERTTAIGKPVQIAFFPAESLVKHFETYDAVVKGVADIGSMWGPQHFPGRMPVVDVMNLPLLFATASSASLTGWELYQNHAEFRQDLSEVKVIGFNPPAPYQIVSRNKPIKTLEDMKGQKCMVRGGIDAEAMSLLGAVPIPMPMPETYMALERGTIDIAPLNWEGVHTFKWYEVTKYRTELPIGLNTSFLIVGMNMETWNGLPPEVQGIIEELSGEYFSKLAGNAMDGEQGPRVDIIKEHDKKVGNDEFYEVPEAEFQKWVQAASPLYESWIADIEKKGLPGRAIFEDLQRLAKKYNAEYPVK